MLEDTTKAQKAVLSAIALHAQICTELLKIGDANLPLLKSQMQSFILLEENICSLGYSSFKESWDGKWYYIHLFVNDVKVLLRGITEFAEGDELMPLAIIGHLSNMGVEFKIPEHGYGIDALKKHAQTLSEKYPEMAALKTAAENMAGYQRYSCPD